MFRHSRLIFKPVLCFHGGRGASQFLWKLGFLPLLHILVEERAGERRFPLSLTLSPPTRSVFP